MTVTYKRLSSYFLERDLSTGTADSGAYYYGNGGTGIEYDSLTSTFESYKIDYGFALSSGTEMYLNYSSYPIELSSGNILIAAFADSTPARIELHNKYGRTIDSKTLSELGITSTLSDSILLELKNGNILVAVGSSSSSWSVATIKISDGNISLVNNWPSAPSAMLTMLQQDDNTVLIKTRTSVLRYFLDGEQDTSFSLDSSLTINFSNLKYGIALQSDGKIIVDTDNLGLQRLFPNGNIDSTFNGGIEPNAGTFRILKDDSIIASFGVTSSNNSYIVKYDKDGALDTSFNSTTNDATSLYGSVNDIHELQDDKILISGFFRNINGSARKAVAMLNADGSLDNNFVFNFDNDNIYNPCSIQVPFIFRDGGILFYGAVVTELNEDKVSTTFYPHNQFNAFKAIWMKVKPAVHNQPYKKIYTVPADSSVVLKNIFATNHNSFPVFYDVVILPAEENADQISQKHFYVWDNLLDDLDYDLINSSITLKEGDEVYVYSSSDENISFNIFGAEISA